MKLKEKAARLKGKKWPKRVLILIIIVVFVVIGVRFAVQKAADSLLNTQSAAEYTIEQVKRQTVENYLSSSGTAQPLNTYSVTTISSIEGTVLSADFEEGDLVKEGDVLYRISTDNLNSKIESAQKNISRAQKKYKAALEDYEEAEEKADDLKITSNMTGFIKTLNIEKGDEIQARATSLAEVYNNKIMVLKIPFLSNEVKDSFVGKTASIEMSESGEEISGEVVKVASAAETLTGNRLVKYVTIEVENPGALSEGDTASASIGSVDSCEDGTFSLYSNGSLTAATSGEIVKVYVEEGDWIEEGDVICRLSKETLNNELENYQDQIDTAKDNLEDAQDSLEEIYDDQADYTITSPITGTVITKNTKTGDTISANNNSALCLIYDLSAMTFEMYVDELDVMKVETGQTVNITADALENETFEGTITNISLVSTSSGGVTQYPVTVQIDEPGSLLPGMNISGEIIIESVENALTVPADAIQRGNVVYVQDETVKEAEGSIPAGFRSVEVEIGISDGSYVEIISGLEEDASVYVPAHVSENNYMMMPGGDMNSDMQGGMQDGGRGERPDGGGQGDAPGGF